MPTLINHEKIKHQPVNVMNAYTGNEQKTL